MKFLKDNVKIFAIASLTIGLAPFNPPHVWGKLQWIFGGGAFSGEQPMQLMDWLDLLMHGTPWLLLIISLILLLAERIKLSKDKQPL